MIDFLPPCLGLFNDRPPATIPKGGLSRAKNIRIFSGIPMRDNMGWMGFGKSSMVSTSATTPLIPYGPITLLDTFTLRSEVSFLMAGTPTDLYYWDSASRVFRVITPTYALTGSFTMTAGSPTLTVNGAPDLVALGVKPGDRIAFGSLSATSAWDFVYSVLSVTDSKHLEMTTPFGGTTGAAHLVTITDSFSGTEDEPWSSATFLRATATDDHWYATNGVDWVARWDGSALRASSLSALGITCKVVATFNQMMLYGNIEDTGERRQNAMRSSAIGEPENVATSDAAEMNAVEVDDTLIALEPLAGNLIAYGRNSISTLQYVGQPLTWYRRPTQSTRTPISRRAIVNYGTHHEFLSREGLCRFNGSGDTLIGEQGFAEVVRTLDAARAHQAIGFRDQERQETLWTVPLTTDPSGYPVMQLCEHYGEEDRIVPITERETPSATAFSEYVQSDSLRYSDLPVPYSVCTFPFDARENAAGFPSKLFGDPSGNVFQFLGDSKDGSDLQSILRTKRVPAIDGTVQGVAARVEYGFNENDSADYSPFITFFGSDQIDGNSVQLVRLAVGMAQNENRWQRPRCRARFFELEVSTLTSNTPWRLTGLRLSAVESGAR